MHADVGLVEVTPARKPEDLDERIGDQVRVLRDRVPSR